MKINSLYKQSALVMKASWQRGSVPLSQAMGVNNATLQHFSYLSKSRLVATLFRTLQLLFLFIFT
jgi:hypothetical protein